MTSEDSDDDNVDGNEFATMNLSEGKTFSIKTESSVRFSRETPKLVKMFHSNIFTLHLPSILCCVNICQ